MASRQNGTGSKTARSSTEKGPPKYLLKLYVAGMSPKSSRAIQSLTHVCEERLKDRYELKIIDIYQQPELAKDANIIAAPTLIKKLPEPLRRLIGDMANEEKLLHGLDITVK
jgi:circadian clock protein KaiB